MALEIGYTYVYPDQYGLPTPGGTGVTAPFPAQVIAVAQGRRDVGYISGNWWSILSIKLRDLINNRPQFGFDGILKGDLVAAHHADFLMATNPSVTAAEAWKIGRDKANRTNLYNTPVLNTETQFSGGTFTAMKAFSHYLMGGGSTVTVPLNSIGISPTPEKIPALQLLVDSAPQGDTHVDIVVPYYTGQDSLNARYYLGNITLNVVGNIKKEASGAVSFIGYARAFNDVYDANRSDHRNDFDERATTGLRAVEKSANAIPYEIQMPGNLPISYSK